MKMKIIRRAVFLPLILLLFAVGGQARGDENYALTAENLQEGKAFELNKPSWKYHAGNDAAWADPQFDDGDWKLLTGDEINSDPAKTLENWNGQGWFRLKLTVDERLVNQPLAWRMWHWGASEIYLDGKLLERFGTVAADGKTGEVERNPHGIPVPFTFETGGEHVLTVHYSFASIGDLSKNFGVWMTRGQFAPGFTGRIQNAGDAIAAHSENIRGYGGNKLYIGILYAFALLHFLLFLFYRQERANLFYSVFAFSLATATLSNNVFNGGDQTAFVSAMFFIIFAFSYGTAFTALQAFLYEAFAPRFSKFFRFACFLLIGQLIIIVIVIRNRISLYATCVLLLILLADSLRLIVSAVCRRRDGAWIIAGGVLILAAGIMMAIAREFQIYIDSQWYWDIGDVTLYLGVPVAVSIYLARSFARTNRHLQEQLAQVREFAEKEVEHERREARLSIVEAENQRQAKELEEARQLQLSMLPKNIPRLPHLEIAAYMKPATEVGGDYYDFYVGADETLTVAVGDATGHGLKAGTMVSVTKGLFNSLAHEPDITNIFRQTSNALKKMNMRGLFMAMTMLKIKGNRLTICAAGMPSVLVYRSAMKTVEKIFIKAMPLGSVTDFPYSEQEFALSDGDCIVIMSDGFPEMFNAEDEMIGFEKAAEMLPEIAGYAPQEIINRFVKTAEAWAGTRPADDDVTFVVLKAVR